MDKESGAFIYTYTMKYCLAIKKNEILPFVATQMALQGIILVMSLLFNMLSRLVTVFLSRSKHLLISRQRHPTPILLLGKSHGRRSLVGCSPWDHSESDTTEQLHFDFSLSCIGEENDNPLQCSCLENPRDGGAWWAAAGSQCEESRP